MHGYLAGSLFNKAEVNERLREGKLLRENFKEETWYNPIESPINDKSKLPTCSDIFKGDYDEVLKSDVIIADITNNDVGVAMELGIAIGINDMLIALKTELDSLNIDEESRATLIKNLEEKGFKKKEIYAHNSDIRTGTSGEYDGHYVPYGQNQFLVGGVEYSGNKIFNSIEEIIEKRRGK